MFGFHKLNFMKLEFQNNMSSSAHSYTNISNQGIRNKFLFVNKAANNQLLDEKSNNTHIHSTDVYWGQKIQK